MEDVCASADAEVDLDDEGRDGRDGGRWKDGTWVLRWLRWDLRYAMMCGKRRSQISFFAIRMDYIQPLALMLWRALSGVVKVCVKSLNASILKLCIRQYAWTVLLQSSLLLI